MRRILFSCRPIGSRRRQSSTRRRIVAALEGWVDAVSAGTIAAGQLAEDGTVVATFDSYVIYDYRARRPTLDIIDGRPNGPRVAEARARPPPASVLATC